MTTSVSSPRAANGAPVSHAPVRSSAWIPTSMALTLARGSGRVKKSVETRLRVDASLSRGLESAPWRARRRRTRSRRARPCPSAACGRATSSRDSANRIHDDAVARQHGFAGALVAGVTIYGYLARIAVDVWERAWLERGTAVARFVRPIYDGES